MSASFAKQSSVILKLFNDDNLIKSAKNEKQIIIWTDLVGVSSPAIAPETPNQLATDRATLAQEQEDAVQQQDNDDIGKHP